MTADKKRALTELERIVKLASATHHIKRRRRLGWNWERIAATRFCNPLDLSPRQICRIYEGEEAYSWNLIRVAARALDTERKT